MTDGRSVNKVSPGARADFQIRKTIIRTKGGNYGYLALREEDDKEQNRRRAMINPHAKQTKAIPAQSIFKQQKETFTPQGPTVLPASALTDEVIKSSKLYRIMEQQIASAISRHAEEMESLMNTLDSQNKESNAYAKESHSLKIKVWELRNQLVRLEGELAQQEQEHAYLTGMTGGHVLQPYPSGQPSEQSQLQESEREMERLHTYQAEEEKQQDEVDSEQMLSETDSTPERKIYSSRYSMNHQ